MQSNEELARYHAELAKAYMLKVRSAKLKLAQMEERRREQAARMKPRGMQYSGMPRNPTVYADAMPDGVAKLQAVDDVIEQYRAEFEELLAECTRALLSMPTFEYSALLEGKFLDGLTWYALPTRVGKSRSQCQAIYQSALVELYDTLPASAKEPLHAAV